MSAWRIAGPYEGEQKFCLVEIEDDGEQYARGMFKTRAEARAKHAKILGERRELKVSLAESDQ